MRANASRMRSRWSSRCATSNGRTAMARAQIGRPAANGHGGRGYGGLLKKLYVQVLIAIALGIAVGEFWPSFGVDMRPLGDGFITLIRSVVPVIIFVTV